MNKKVHEINHALAKHYLSLLRDKNTKPSVFRRYAQYISFIIASEAFRNMPTKNVSIETPIMKSDFPLMSEKIVLVPILRAGLSMTEGIIQFIPNTSVGHIGIERDEKTAIPSSYYSKFPNCEGRYIFITDPMLATGGSASYAIEVVKKFNPKKISLLTIISAPEGIENIHNQFPDIDIFTSCIDSHLDENKYIVPGLGDFGDRLYDTLV